MKKILIGLFLCTFALCGFAKPMHIKTIHQSASANNITPLNCQSKDCDAATQVCICMIGDESITADPPLNTQYVATTIADGKTYTSQETGDVGHGEGGFFFTTDSISMNDIKNYKVSEDKIELTTVGGQQLSPSCVVDLSKPFTPGIYAIIIFKNGSSYSCKNG